MPLCGESVDVGVAKIDKVPITGWLVCKNSGKTTTFLTSHAQDKIR
jgi:hypothetical protein